MRLQGHCKVLILLIECLIRLHHAATPHRLQNHVSGEVQHYFNSINREIFGDAAFAQLVPLHACLYSWEERGNSAVTLPISTQTIKVTLRQTATVRRGVVQQPD